MFSKWHPFNAEGTPLPVSSDATKTCVISLSEKIWVIAAICKEESVPDGEKIISDSSLSLNIFLRLFFNNSEKSIVAFLNPFFKLFLINMLLILSVLSKAKLETLVAVDEENVNASGLGNGRQPYLLSKSISSIFNLRSPPSINKYSVGLARFLTMVFQVFLNILLVLFTPCKAVSSVWFNKVSSLKSVSFLIKFSKK